MRLLLCALLAALPLGTPVFAQGAASALVIRGAGITPLTLSLADLRALPVTRIDIVQGSGRGPVKLDCSGVTLEVLLKKAAPDYGTAKNARLAHTLLVTAADGYAVALAVAETEFVVDRNPVILATTCNGTPLDAPRLVVPADVGAARSVHGVATIEIRK